MNLRRVGLLLRTAWALGLGNVARVLVYRVLLRFGLHPAQHLQAAQAQAPFFLAPKPVPAAGPEPANRIRLFGWHEVSLDVLPEWLRSAGTGEVFAGAGKPWWQIPDFDAAAGDIKWLWELSRMEWALVLARRAAHGDGAAVARLNQWLADWLAHNAPYTGPNWKCGQEASLRVLHLLAAAILLGDWQSPNANLKQLVSLHLARIAPTTSYARAQDNNHGTSEAAALYVGGAWLVAHGEPAARRWVEQGRKLLVNRVRHLIEEDGSFSQYSVNYHRLMLDSLALAEWARRALSLPAWPADIDQKLAAASYWLYQLTDPASGDAPNLGANDGARILPFAETAPRDFRPSVQLAMTLFCGETPYADDATPEALAWLGLEPGKSPRELPPAWLAKDGGFAVLRQPGTWLLLRAPHGRFRPSQADVLHVDVWRGGQNLLRDSGTFSYALPEQDQYGFAGVAGHNTVEFDGRDQMPRLGRFLYGHWPRCPLAMTEAGGLSARFQDWQGAVHEREVTLAATALKIEDRVSGFSNTAALRWHLPAGDWVLAHEDGACTVTCEAFPDVCVRISASVAMQSCVVQPVQESRAYLQSCEARVLEVTVTEPGTLTTWLEFRA